jgi:N-methylhydantoinase B
VQRTADLMVEALSDLLPESAIAASHVSFPAFVFQAVDPRSGRLTLLADIIGGGGGARRGADGEHAIDTYTSNCAILPAEVAELEYPFLIERSELVDGSGGAGTTSGGLGIRRDYRLLGDAGDGMYYVEQHDPRFAPAGREGGADGSSSSVRLQRDGVWQELPSKGYLILRRGDVVSFVSSGGGGFGAPGET